MTYAVTLRLRDGTLVHVDIDAATGSEAIRAACKPYGGYIGVNANAPKSAHAIPRPIA